ncbi:MAG: 6-hydroxycyclohex-1-ene-1-carbonyl-CoA dehydrogenase [bacterium]
MNRIQAWKVEQIAKPMVQVELPEPVLSEHDVLVRVAGCGVCHTDLGFYYDGVPTVKPFPLVLGHEISGIVEDAGSVHKSLIGTAVIVPAVMPCGECELCKKGRGTICRQQKMPGNHINGGFANHIVVPGRHLCPVEAENETALFGDSGVSLRELSVIADAVTTPYQAIKNAGLVEGDLAIFIGVGGVGGFGVQIAKAMGATVAAIDIDAHKLQMMAEVGANVTFNPKETEAKAIRKQVRNFAAEHGLSPYEWKIFETSGTAPGQELAYSLLTFGATLSVVGFTMDKVQVRLSNLMAYDARAIGNWGCVPEYYPEVLELVRTGKIQLQPFVEPFGMREINSVFEKLHKREIIRRPVLVPDFD